MTVAIKPSRKANQSRLHSRARRLMREEPMFIMNLDFETLDPDADHRILERLIAEPDVEADEVEHQVSVFGKRALPLLTADEERVLFRRMNYLRYRVIQNRSKLNLRRPSRQRIEQMERDLQECEAVRSRIVESNLRLVLSIARRMSKSSDQFDDFVSDGLMVLLGAIDKFDYSRGFRFSTYATHAVQRHIFRCWKKQQRRRERFPRLPDELLQEVPAMESKEQEVVASQRTFERLMKGASNCLDARERMILSARFGFDGPIRTLRDVAQEMGLSKERVRQLQMRAVQKLQELASELRLAPA